MVLGLLSRFRFWSYFEVFVVDSISCAQLHSVRIDNFSFFLEVKSILLSQYLGFVDLVLVLLLVIRNGRFGVGVPHEPVCATSLSSSLVTSR